MARLKSQTYEERQALILPYLQRQPGVEVSASSLSHVVPKTFVGRALTTDHKNPRPKVETAIAENAIPGVRMRYYFNREGTLKKSAWWFSWIGIEP